MNEFVNRVLKPASIPLFGALFIAVLVFSFSRILLAVPEMGSTSLSLLIAAEILGVAAFIAAGSRVKSAQKVLLGILSLGLIAGGGASAAIGVRTIEAHAEGIPIAANALKFDKATLDVPADEHFAIEFNNQEAVPHNVAIYKSKGGEALFTGEIFSGPATRAYDVDGIPAGSYYFQCDVHPNMNGTVNAGEGGGHGEAPPAAQPTTGTSPSGQPSTQPSDGGHAGVTEVTVVAKQIQFDKNKLDLAADTPVTIHLDNQDPSIPHNLSIYKGSDASGEAILKEDPFPGVKTETYTVTAPAGSYYFQCDLHPNMKGTAVFH